MMYGSIQSSPMIRQASKAGVASVAIVAACACLVFVGLISSTTRSSLAQFEKLDSLTSEFDPFTDADSNYGRVLSLRSISRTNGAIPEDMDTNGEYKGRLQQLFSMPSQFVDHKTASYAPLPDAGVVGTDKSFLAVKNNKGGQWYEGVEKSPRAQMLANAPALFKDHPATGKAPLPDAGVLGTDTSFYHSAQKKEKKATHYSDVPEAGIVGTDRSFLASKSNKGGSWYEGVDKSPVQMLARPLRFQSKRHPQQLPEAGDMGTNKAFLGKADGSGQSTKAVRTQKLYDIDGPQDTDPKYRSWLKAADHQSSPHLNRQSSIAAQIRAALPPS